MLFDTLESRALTTAGLIDPLVARSIAVAHLAGRADHGRQLWTLVCFQLWYARFVAGAADSRPVRPDPLLV